VYVSRKDDVKLISMVKLSFSKEKAKEYDKIIYRFHTNEFFYCYLSFF